MKKGSGKSKTKPVAPAKKRTSKPKKPIDLAEVRKDIANLVGGEATELAQAVMEEGRKGQLAPVKYLFEMTGLYPALDQSLEKPQGESLARTLLHRLGLPDNPVIKQDDEPPLQLNPDGKAASHGAEQADSAADGLQPGGENISGAENRAEENTQEDNGAGAPAQSIP